MNPSALINPRQDSPEVPVNHSIRFLVFSASLQTNSLNTRLARLAVKVLEKSGVIADYAEMKEFDCPSYNQDMENQKMIPPGAEELKKRISACDAFVISSPEYNASLPGHLKNVIDWVSRYRPQPFNEKHALLMSASPSMVGGNRALWSLRVPLEHLGTRVFPDMFSLAMAHQAFTPEGELGNNSLAQRFENTLGKFKDLVEAATHYPCIRKAWVEFLGEHPEPLTARTE
jgi:chromate reductase, NAD(P)H dehydrogenase (quinone)